MLRTIKLDDIEYVRRDDIQNMSPAINTDGLKYYIVRCHDAGVHAGYAKSIEGRTTILVNSRRLWRWNSPDNTLSGIANQGPYSAQECKFGEPVQEIILTETCENILCTSKAKESIEAVQNWNFGGNK
jgi:hypothetical protein